MSSRWRTPATYSGAWPARTRHSSWRKATSRAQWRRFSMPQWARTAVVLLERQDVVGAALDDLWVDGGLAGHGVVRDEAALDQGLLQQRGDGGDVVRFVALLHLPDHQPVGRGPGADHVDRRLARAPL